MRVVRPGVCKDCDHICGIGALSVVDGCDRRRVRSYDTYMTFETCSADCVPECLDVSFAKRVVAQRVYDEYRVFPAVEINTRERVIAGIDVAIPGLWPFLSPGVGIDRQEPSSRRIVISRVQVVGE